MRRLFLGLGVALGLASGQPDPGFYASLSVIDGGVALYARVEDCFAPGALELVEAGTRVALRYSARLEGKDGRAIEASETRALWYDIRSGFYGVSFANGSKTTRLVDPQAARNLVSELRLLELCRVEDAAPGTSVEIKAEIGIVDAKGEWHAAPVLWNYCEPRSTQAIGARPSLGATGKERR